MKIMVMAVAAFSAGCVLADTVSLDAGSLKLGFERENGALVSMVSAKTGWEFNRRDELGCAWKMIVPLDGRFRDNRVLSADQSSPEVETGDGFIRFVWDGVVSERAGHLAIKITQEIRREGDAAVWHTRIENNSPYIVESVFSPVVGDLWRPDGAEYVKLTNMSYSQAWENIIWPTFAATHTDGSVLNPTQVKGNCSLVEPFIFVHTQNQGLYAGVKTTEAATVAWFFELCPGFESSMSQNVPDCDEIAGKTVHTVFSTVHQPYIASGQTLELSPVMYEAYEGDWHDGCDIYVKWMRTWSFTRKAPDWAAEPHSWLQYQMNSPEGEYRMRFSEIPALAKECAAYGVKAMQLVGWNDGGQDQGNPSHDPDPNLGTYEELKAAAEECERLGVKLVIFTKFTWADRATDWYRNDLCRYAIKDPYGDAAYYRGYSYMTPSQLLDIGTKRFATMCFGASGYFDVCAREFAKVAGLGAAGMLYDECQHHSPALNCFDRFHDHPYGWSVYSNDLKLIDRLEATDGLRKDFLVAGEAVYDKEFERYQLSYFRSRFNWHVPMQRYIRPEAQIMTALNGMNDRDMVDQCLMYRYIISYEPMNFHGFLHDFPATVEYGERMNALRTKLRKWLWDGTFTDTVGAKMSFSGGDIFGKFARFVADDGSEMIVASNYTDETIEVRAELDSLKMLSRYRAVEDEGWTAIPESGLVEIPAHSAVVIGE